MFVVVAHEHERKEQQRRGEHAEAGYLGGFFSFVSLCKCLCHRGSTKERMGSLHFSFDSVFNLPYQIHPMVLHHSQEGEKLVICRRRRSNHRNVIESVVDMFLPLEYEHTFRCLVGHVFLFFVSFVLCWFFLSLLREYDHGALLSREVD